MVFKHGLEKILEPAERVEADSGYQVSVLELVKCRGVVEVDLDNVEMQQRVKSHQEMVNKHFEIGQYCRTHTANSCLSTKLFLVLL